MNETTNDGTATREPGDAAWDQLRREFDQSPIAPANEGQAPPAETNRTCGPTGTAVACGTQPAVERPRQRGGVSGVSRDAASKMTYRQYEAAKSECDRLTSEGTRRELAPGELTRLRQARDAVVGYLDFIFGPEPAGQIKPAVVQPRRTRTLGRAGRFGRFLHRH